MNDKNMRQALYIMFEYAHKESNNFNNPIFVRLAFSKLAKEFINRANGTPSQIKQSVRYPTTGGH